MKSRQLKWVCNVARMGGNENYIPSWLENRRERDL